MRPAVRFFPNGFSGGESGVIELPFSDTVERSSLLDSLLAAGIKVPHSCRAGLCQACVLQSDAPVVLNPEATQGLSEEQVRQGLLMSCQCFPAEPLNLALPSHDTDWEAQLIGRQLYSGGVIELTFTLDRQWRPGQHVLLWMDEEHARPYSIASLCDESKHMVIHVQRHYEGLVSQWCHDELVIGERVRMSAAQGHCVFDAHQRGDILLLAEGSGFGFLAGIAQQALKENTETSVDLVYVNAPQMQEQASELPDYPPLPAAVSANWGFHRVSDAAVPNASAPEVSGFWRRFLEERIERLSARRVYIAGGESFVALLSKVCFFAGVSRRQMLTEVFTRGNGDDH